MTTTTETGDGLPSAVEYTRHGRTGRWINDWRPLGVATVLIASMQNSLPLFLTGFILLFVLSTST